MMIQRTLVFHERTRRLRRRKSSKMAAKTVSENGKVTNFPPNTVICTIKPQILSARPFSVSVCWNTRLHGLQNLSSRKLFPFKAQGNYVK